MDIVSMYTYIPLREAITVNLKAYDTSVFQYKLKRYVGLRRCLRIET
jgi:hypothetical protein